MALLKLILVFISLKSQAGPNKQYLIIGRPFSPGDFAQ
jgi:hypothetical protein